MVRAIRYPARGEVRLADLPDPAPGPGEVLLEVRASGLCHTDVDVLHARYGPGAFPVVPGHEFAGEVVDLGAGVDGVALGDRVVVDPNLACGTCRACRRGRSNLCATLGAYGVSADGGMAVLAAVRADRVHPIGALDWSTAALAEPMACALNGLRAADPVAEDAALIFGAGPIGLLIGMALRARGLARIAFADVDEARLALAEGFGFDAVPAGSGALDAMARDRDLVVDATGRAEVAGALPRYAADGGTCLFFGVCPPDARIEVVPFELFRRQLRLQGSHSLDRNIPEALAAIRACGPAISRLVPHRVPLDGMAAILRDGPPRGGLKVQAVAS